MSRPVLAMCDACGFKHEATFYHCTVCGEYCIHEKSMYSQTTIFIQETTAKRYHHDHQLHLVYSLPESSQFQPKCEICEEFKPLQWLYHCQECNYFVHYSCARWETEPFMSIFLPPGKPSLPSSNPNAPRLPFSEQSHSMVRHRFYWKKNDDDDILVGRLITIDMENSNNNSEPSSSESKLFSPHHYPTNKIRPLCDVCLKPITNTKFYKCPEDQFHDIFFHEWCVKLKLRGHPPFSESHDLRLVKKGTDKSIRSSFGLFRCDACNSKFNGLAFQCEKCRTYFDPNCCSLPSSIVHEAHPDHVLYLDTASPSHISKCRACSHQPNEKYEFHCAVCNFKLHMWCALLPGKIIHRYDDHPLILTFSHPENPKAEYFCEICEDEVDAKEWFYYCVECNQAMHAGCGSLYDCGQSQYTSSFVHHFDSSAKIKFGGVIKIESHPHPLSFVRSIENKTTKCAKCGEHFKFEPFECDIGFVCLGCNYALHHKCGLPPESSEEKILVKCSDYYYREQLYYRSLIEWN